MQETLYMEWKGHTTGLVDSSERDRIAHGPPILILGVVSEGIIVHIKTTAPAVPSHLGFLM